MLFMKTNDNGRRRNGQWMVNRWRGGGGGVREVGGVGEVVRTQCKRDEALDNFTELLLKYNTCT